MTDTMLALALSEKNHHILSEKDLNESGKVIVSYDWYSFLSHETHSNPLSLKSILGEGKHLALNAVPITPLKKVGDRFKVKSRVNGAMLSFSLADLMSKKDVFNYMVLPEECFVASLSQFDKRIFCLKDLTTFQSELSHTSVALNVNQIKLANVIKAIIEYSSQHASSRIMVKGNISLSDAIEFAKYNVEYIETSTPLESAIKGWVYAKHDLIDINETVYRHQHSPIDSECNCYTCQHHTRAYLHHLFRYTPLLAIKLQAIHNVRYWVNCIRSLSPSSF